MGEMELVGRLGLDATKEGSDEVKLRGGEEEIK